MFSYLSSLKRIVFIALVSLGAHLYSDTNETAFISVPVADLTVEPYYKFSKKGFTIDDYYNKIPFSGSWQACKRAHQLLFNERVTVLEEKGAEVKIQISNFYFLNANGSVPSDTYWTLKKNLTYIKDLKIKKSDSYKIPYSISYKENNITSKTTEATITLKKPFYDPITKEIYSVGTRFTLASDLDHKGPHGKGHFEAYIYDTQVKKIKILQVPRLNCVRNYSKKPEDKIQNFVQVLRLWAYQKDGAIPYVLGGWSWTITCDSDDFEVHKESGSEHSYHRKKWPHDSKIGFDCMGIIGRAAQICELPFYIKNTTTLLKDLKPLKRGEKISEGDFLLYPGHVMVVSSVEKGMIIEAVGYERKAGKVHEVPVENVFKEVKNLDELKKRYFEDKPMTVLHSDGKPWRTFKRIKILKISSIWQNS